MKFFIDTANLEAIKEIKAMGMCDGVTTNPSLMAKEGNTDTNSVLKEICDVVQGPVSGEVTEINTALLAELEKDSHATEAMGNDPYGKGWILKIKPENFDRERKGLLSGNLARKWMEEEVEQLRSKMSPELGDVMQDGGVPLAGMAKNIDGEEWDLLLKEFFLT